MTRVDPRTIIADPERAIVPKGPERAIAIDAERITAGPETPSEAITDLLADIRHYCDTYDLDYAELDRVAYGHYLEERGSR